MRQCKILKEHVEEAIGPVKVDGSLFKPSSSSLAAEGQREGSTV